MTHLIIDHRVSGCFGTSLAPKVVGELHRTTSSIGRNEVRTGFGLFWQCIQTLQRPLSGQFRNSLIKVGDMPNTRVDPIDGLFVGRNRLFYGCKDFSKCVTSPVAWIVCEVLTVPV